MHPLIPASERGMAWSVDVEQGPEVAWSERNPSCVLCDSPWVSGF